MRAKWIFVSRTRIHPWLLHKITPIYPLGHQLDLIFEGWMSGEENLKEMVISPENQVCLFAISAQNVIVIKLSTSANSWALLGL